MKRIYPLCIACAVALPGCGYAQSTASAWASPTMPVPGMVTAGKAPVAQALAKIIPPPYRIELDQSVPSGLELTWRGGTNWMQILRAATAPVGLIVEPNWAYNTIEIVRAPTPAVHPVAPHARVTAATPPRVPAHAAAAKPALPGSFSTPVAAAKASPRLAVAVARYGNGILPLPHPTTPVPPPSAFLSAHGSGFHGPVSGSDHVATVVVHSHSTHRHWPMRVSDVGAAYAIGTGQTLSSGLSKYVGSFGWTLEWQLPKDYPVNALLPIPALSLEAGAEYVLRAYQARGALTRAIVVLSTPNHVAVVEPATAEEH